MNSKETQVKNNINYFKFNKKANSEQMITMTLMKEKLIYFQCALQMKSSQISSLKIN